MDAFSPAQYTFISSLRKRHNSAPRRPRLSSELALGVLALLNVPAHLRLRQIWLDAQDQASIKITKWLTSTTSGRIVGWIPFRKYWKPHLVSLRACALHLKDKREFFSLLSCSRGGPLWTWMTANFVHKDTTHLLANLASLAAYGLSCVHIPGMSPSHIAAVAIGSCLSSSAAWQLFLVLHDDDTTVGGIGASGMVCGFAGLAAAAEAEPFGLPSLSKPRSLKSILVVGSFSLEMLANVMGLLRVFGVRALRSWSGLPPNIGYAAHLGGAVFGIAYYFFILRPRDSDPKSTRPSAETGSSWTRWFETTFQRSFSRPAFQPSVEDVPEPRFETSLFNHRDYTGQLPTIVRRFPDVYQVNRIVQRQVRVTVDDDNQVLVNDNGQRSVQTYGRVLVGSDGQPLVGRDEDMPRIERWAGTDYIGNGRHPRDREDSSRQSTARAPYDFSSSRGHRL